MTEDFKKRIISAIKVDRKDNYDTDTKQAVSLGISATQLSLINSGKLEGVLSNAKWLTIARRLGVHEDPQEQWHTAKTPVFETVYRQLYGCQHNAFSALLVDDADIGKTYTAKCYAREHKNAVYIDCSQVKTKTALVRKIATEFGVDNGGNYLRVFETLVHTLRTFNTPLIILDEAGDLTYEAFLELKALWNATERCCGWYMMGADGLKAKIDRNLLNMKVGYTEIFSRFGARYQRVTPFGSEEIKKFKRQQTSMIGKVNGVEDLTQLHAKTNGSLRRVYIEVQKQKQKEVE